MLSDMNSCNSGQFPATNFLLFQQHNQHAHTGMYTNKYTERPPLKVGQNPRFCCPCRWIKRSVLSDMNSFTAWRSKGDSHPGVACAVALLYAQETGLHPGLVGISTTERESNTPATMPWNATSGFATSVSCWILPSKLLANYQTLCAVSMGPGPEDLIHESLWVRYQDTCWDQFVALKASMKILSDIG